MSPRANRRRPDPAPAGRGAPETVEDWPDGSWVVRRVTGAGATKAYRCPGCDHEVRPGTAHLVAWPVEGGLLGAAEGGRSGAADRRHWHRPCWEARLRRGPRR